VRGQRHDLVVVGGTAHIDIRIVLDSHLRSCIQGLRAGVIHHTLYGGLILVTHSQHVTSCAGVGCYCWVALHANNFHCNHFHITPVTTGHLLAYLVGRGVDCIGATAASRFCTYQYRVQLSGHQRQLESEQASIRVHPTAWPVHGVGNVLTQSKHLETYLDLLSNVTVKYGL
jgi:hypothetical protein